MNYKIILKVLGELLFLEALLFASCIGIALFKSETDLHTFIIPTIVALLTGAALKWLGRSGRTGISRRDGYLCVTLSWLTFSLIGALPFVVGGYTGNFSVAFFESMSGFTTTGATALSHIDTLPHSILFWRSLMHWFGGLGIVFFTIAILPKLGSGGFKLFSAEASGLKLDKLHPRITTTTRWLWAVYLFLTVTCCAAYYLAGMSLWDAVNHAFSTVATGGFSTHSNSMAAFCSPSVEVTATIFMFLSGINFTLIYLFFIKRRFKAVLHDSELRTFFTVYACATLFIVANVWIHTDDDALTALRHGAFYAASLQTSSGFTTTDIVAWPGATWFVLLLLTAIGGCAGSASGGIKCVRVLTCFKEFKTEFRRMLHPNAVIPLRLNQTPVTARVSQAVFAFMMGFIFLVIVGTLGFSLIGFSMLDSVAATVSMLGNAGVVLGHDIAPLGSWAQISDAGLWLASVLMLMGRLEVFTLLLPLTTEFWHDN